MSVIRRYPFFDEVVCNNILDFYSFSDFVDGERTGPSDKRIKNNLQMANQPEALDNLFTEQFFKTPVSKGMLVKRITQPLFLDYKSENQGHYHFHNDAPFMSGRNVRSDFVIIIALNDESEYEGGDLIIRSGTENCAFRLQKGVGIFFDPNMWHMVSPVTSGSRKVVVCWAETYVSDPWARELMYDYLDQMSLMKTTMEQVDREHGGLFTRTWKTYHDIDPYTYQNAIYNKLTRKYVVSQETMDKYDGSRAINRYIKETGGINND